MTIGETEHKANSHIEILGPQKCLICLDCAQDMHVLNISRAGAAAAWQGHHFYIPIDECGMSLNPSAPILSFWMHSKS